MRCSTSPPPKCLKLQYRLFPLPPSHRMQWQTPAKSSTQLLAWYSNRPTDLLSGQPSALWSTWQSPRYSILRYLRSPSMPCPLPQWQPPAKSSTQLPVWCSSLSTDRWSMQRPVYSSRQTFAGCSTQITAPSSMLLFAQCSAWPPLRYLMPRYQLFPSKPCPLLQWQPLEPSSD